MNRDSLSLSPQQLDPMSWYTRALVPMAFAIVNFVFGVATIASVWNSIGHAWFDVFAVVLISISCCFVQVRTSPFRGPFRARNGMTALGIAVAGLALSTWANAGSSLPVQVWWAPIGMAIALAALAPYSSVLLLLAYGSVLTMLTVVAALVAFLLPLSPWPPLSAGILGGVNLVMATVAAAVFCYVVVSRTRATVAAAGRPESASDSLVADAAHAVEVQTIASLSARVAPFVERIAAAGYVTDDDRALAGQLARRLRWELVERTNSTWLDRVAERGRIFVVDPERRAEHMNSAQRAALRAFIVAAMSQPGTDTGSMFIELRPRDDGSTAVALSVDIERPEGRRATMLAPYYIALQATVTDLQYDAGRELLRFEVRD